ncbi:hypothetical protein SNEBB_005074 [Seison nebaliae]|nr:hypothetical protein SNEBB_005074 [Seison nebaliae]
MNFSISIVVLTILIPFVSLRTTHFQAQTKYQPRQKQLKEINNGLSFENLTLHRSRRFSFHHGVSTRLRVERQKKCLKRSCFDLSTCNLCGEVLYLILEDLYSVKYPKKCRRNHLADWKEEFLLPETCCQRGCSLEQLMYLNEKFPHGHK